jgi:NAD(P)-dependent dehydrogenase (short-subunit alcohol dehydrogenase family)
VVQERDLSGRKALVIGAGTQNGRAIAVALAAAGADVAVASATTDGEEVMAARRTRRAVEALGRRAAEYAFDTTLGQNVHVSTRQVSKEMGGLDVLVNAQDAPLLKAAERTSDSEWSRILALNLGGVFAACRAAAREITTGGGSIINVIPELTAVTMQQSAAYVAARYGVIGLSRALAAEYTEQAIRVNALVVGAPQNPGSTAATRNFGTPDPWTAATATGLPAELGLLAVYLAGSTGQAVTGQALWVPGPGA